MPVITPGVNRDLGVIDAGSTDPRGERTTFFWETDRGIPRRDDLGIVRMLEKTHAVSLPLNQIKTQVSTTPFTIAPTVDEPTDAHFEAAEEIEEFLRGNYNSNGAPFDHLTKQWAHDIVSIDTGIIEKVPDSQGFIDQLYNRDGAVFTKSLDVHDRLPEPPEAAYWQFQFSGAFQPFDPTKSLHDMAEEFSAYPYRSRRGEPIGFSREQILWTETNPAPWRHYGFGKVQQAKRLAEIILNQDSSNVSYFSQNEVPDGVVNVVEANQDEIESFRQYWKDEVRGHEHVLPIIGGAGSQIEWIPFRPTPDELEFMASQKWYHQLIWMVFGLNQGEVGDIENINRATMKEQATNVFRTTTKPLLDRLANDFNTHILPFMEAYHRVGGELEFAWQIDNPAMREKEREEQRNRLESGTTTVNEIRQERGEEPLDWGDMPIELMRSVARTHPGWALEQWADVEEPPAPPAGPGLLSAYSGSGKAITPGTSKPFENEHSCRLMEPGQFDEFRRENGAAEVDGKSVDFIFGVFEDEDDSELQAIRYPLDEGWSEDAARAHCEEQDSIMFEPAEPEEEALGGCGSGNAERHLVIGRDADAYRAALERVKDDDSLRDEPYEGQYPPLVGHVEGTESMLTDTMLSFEEELLSIAEENFPEEEPPEDFAHRPHFEDDLENFAVLLSNELTGDVVQSNREAMEVSAQYHADELEDEAERMLSEVVGKQDEEVGVSIEFDVEDTFAYERMEAEAASRMVTVGQTVKEQVRRTLLNVAEDGGNVTEATSELQGVLDTNIPNHARLVARTETLMAQRSGSQALAESSDLIAGKRWNTTGGSSGDGRTRAWHAEMHDEIVPKDDSFIVPSVNDPDQPNDYPREAFTVGDDQPFNCRCAQDPVLQEDMPDDLQELNALDGVQVVIIPKDSERMREVVKEHADGVTSLSEMLSNALDAAGSKNAAAELLGVSTATLYDWGNEVGSPEF